MKNENIIESLLEASDYYESLNEDVLNEAEARDIRKESNKTAKHLKSDIKHSDFAKGNMTKDAADKYYQEAIGKLKDLKAKVDNMPKETPGEIVASLFRENFTVDGFLKNWAITIITSPLYSTAFPAAVLKFFQIACGVASRIWTRKTSKDGELNWNKTYAESIIKSTNSALNKIYMKKYHGDVTILYS